MEMLKVEGSWKWKDTMEEFVHYTLSYLGQYYLRNNSESGFSADKRWFGWIVGQKKDDIIETALSCTGIWHNFAPLIILSHSPILYNSFVHKKNSK